MWFNYLDHLGPQIGLKQFSLFLLLLWLFQAAWVSNGVALDINFKRYENLKHPYFYAQMIWPIPVGYLVSIYIWKKTKKLLDVDRSPPLYYAWWIAPVWNIIVIGLIFGFEKNELTKYWKRTFKWGLFSSMGLISWFHTMNDGN